MSEPKNFIDVYESDDSGWTLSYRSGRLVYQESVVEGHFVGRGWNGAGFIILYSNGKNLVARLKL